MAIWLEHYFPMRLFARISFIFHLRWIFQDELALNMAFPPSTLHFHCCILILALMDQYLRFWCLHERIKVSCSYWIFFLLLLPPSLACTSILHSVQTCINFRSLLILIYLKEMFLSTPTLLVKILSVFQGPAQKPLCGAFSHLTAVGMSLFSHRCLPKLWWKHVSQPACELSR